MGDDLFKTPDSQFCLAGKNDIAVGCLQHLLSLGIEPGRIRVILNKDDVGRSTWQQSLGFHARRAGVACATLDEMKTVKDLWFFSVEFDRILKPAEFSSDWLFNVHFSKLPAYRGVATSVWPILRGERETGVTFHRIDAGIDTGPILCQRTFPIGASWTARDLYFRYLAEGLSLFREALELLRSGQARDVPQDESAASLFRRRDLDYGKLAVDTSLGVSQVCAQLRAYSFWEYQLPSIGGRKVWSASIIPGSATAAAGTVRPTGTWHGVLSVADGDLELRYSPYEELYAWAAGVGQPLALAEVPDLDLQDVQGWSAMMKAANAGNVAALRALAAAGASVTKANRRGTTPLMYAFTRMLELGDADAFRALVELGADPSARDQHGRTIADYLPADAKPRLQAEYPEIFR
ncbi:MAG: Methionyl-tRNA formyltransferase [Verrucomicrobiota bacterium]|jgi:methionyl-tRNA formyltransferase